TVAVVDLREREAVPVIGSLADAFGDRVATVSRADRRPAAEPGRLVDELERTHDTVVLATAVADPADWLNFCRRQADRVLCVADVTDRPQPAGLALLAGCDLALTGQPSGRTASWLDALRPRAHHWLDLPNREAGVARLVRAFSADRPASCSPVAGPAASRTSVCWSGCGSEALRSTALAGAGWVPLSPRWS